jgi:hypothetical protein
MLKFKSWPPEVGCVEFSDRSKEHIETYEHFRPRKDDMEYIYDPVSELGHACGRLIAINAAPSAFGNDVFEIDSLAQDLSDQVSALAPESDAAKVFTHNFLRGVQSEIVATQIRERFSRK